MIIRKMTIEDYDEVYALWMSCVGMGLNNLDDSREGIEKFLKRNPDTCFVAVSQEAGEENGKEDSQGAGKKVGEGVSQEDSGNAVVGVIMAGNDGRRGYIYHTAVNPRCRNQGIASELIEAAMEALKQCEINKVALVVFDRNESGNQFWQNRGFTVREDLIYRNKAITEMIRIHT